LGAANETDGTPALPNVVNDDVAAVDAAPVDLAFLAEQTFGDRALERDVLLLFVAQARRVVPSLPSLTAEAGAAAAHLLKGSSRGIGAWRCADLADAYEAADAETRTRLYARLAMAFARAEAAIAAHLATPR
jgi:hypothetical protein